MDIRQRWVGCMKSLCVLCPTSGIRYEETLIAAEQGITRCFHRNGLLPWSGDSWSRQAPCSSLFPLSTLSTPFWQQEQQPTAPGTSFCFSVFLSGSCHLLPSPWAWYSSTDHCNAAVLVSWKSLEPVVQETFKLRRLLFSTSESLQTTWRVSQAESLLLLKQCKGCFKPKAEMWLSSG